MERGSFCRIKRAVWEQRTFLISKRYLLPALPFLAPSLAQCAHPSKTGGRTVDRGRHQGPITNDAINDNPIAAVEREVLLFLGQMGIGGGNGDVVYVLDGSPL